MRAAHGVGVYRPGGVGRQTALGLEQKLREECKLEKPSIEKCALLVISVEEMVETCSLMFYVVNVDSLRCLLMGPLAFCSRGARVGVARHWANVLLQ